MIWASRPASNLWPIAGWSRMGAAGTSLLLDLPRVAGRFSERVAYLLPVSPRIPCRRAAGALPLSYPAACPSDEHPMAQRKHGRAEYRTLEYAGSIEEAKPWLAEGISRTTWYRRRTGQVTRAEYLASIHVGSLADIQPWRILGVSRATWFRRRAAARASA
jgi:hypothetical protein